MFKHGFPSDWSTIKKLIWLKGAGIIGGASAIWKTLTGTLIHITDALASPMQKCEVTLEPIQDLHGQDAPYPDGGCDNKLPFMEAFRTTKNGITFSSDGRGTYTFSGTAIADASVTFNVDEVTLPSTAYLHLKNSGTSVNVFLNVFNNNTRLEFLSCSSEDRIFNATSSLGGKTINKLELKVASGTAISGTITMSPMILETNASTAFKPYSNICPITGWTGCEVTRTGKNLFDISTATFKKWRLSGSTFSTRADSSTDVTFSVTGDEVTISNGVTYCGIGVILDAVPYERTASVSSDIGGAVQFWSAYEDGATRISTGAMSCTIPANTSGFLALRHDTTGSVTTKFQVELGSTASDYEPYQGTTLSVTFPSLTPNQFDEVMELGGISSQTGADSTENTTLRSKNYISIKPDTEYYFCCDGWGSNKNVMARFYGADKSYIGSRQKDGSTVKKNAVFTTPENAYFLRFVAPSDYGTTYNNDISVNYPATVTTYNAYNNTVYGGTVDLVSGVLKSKYASVDLGTLTWVSAWGGFATYDLTDAIYTKEQVAMNMICSNYPNVSYISKADKTIYGCDPNGQGNYNFVAVQGSGYSTPADFKTAMSGVQLVYELAEPIEIQLTPQQIATLKGENNVWSNSNGDTTLIYKAQA